MIRESPHYQNVDYVVADLDGVNAEFSSEAVANCWLRSGWDVCTANQDGPYYDIWALRHPYCRRMIAGAIVMQSLGLSRFQSMYVSVFARIRISVDHDWIEVNSAFGGLAIY